MSDRLVGLAVDYSLRGDVGSCYSDDELVSGLVRQALLNGGFGVLDKTAPLKDVIRPGTSVLLKPNWVLHYNKSGHTLDCSITHNVFIIAVLREVLAAKPYRVIIADAPIQSADFARIISPALLEEILRARVSSDVVISDLRNVIAVEENGVLTTKAANRSIESIITFDLGQNSLLEEISIHAHRFRNTSYNPDVMRQAHSCGYHLYRLCCEPFEADVIINLPKLKAHGKVGITAAIKNVVGLNADKDILPHHRTGGSSLGGDCYKGFKPLKRLSELCLDKSNRRIGYSSYFYWIKMAGACNFLHKIMGDPDLEGKWYGNDTVWRMVLDLNRLILYGRSDGRIGKKPRRNVLTITDGILAGEGNGPLAPTPLPLGVVTCGTNSPTLDLVHAGLFHFDWKKIPLIRESFRTDCQLPLTMVRPEQIKVQTSKGVFSPDEVAEAFGVSCQPPDGWKNHIEGTYWKNPARLQSTH